MRLWMRRSMELTKTAAAPANFARLLAFFFLAVIPLCAQKDPPPAAQQDQAPVFHAQSNVVLVPALVKDGHGKIVYGLQADDFILEDNGVEQAVKLDEAAEAQPISV